jgi:hypothetical protein
VNAAYELWEMRSGNLMGSFPIQEEALTTLAGAVKRYGPSYADTITLTWESGDESKDLASGPDLAAWAMNVAG